jgi:hypothetical protein
VNTIARCSAVVLAALAAAGTLACSRTEQPRRVQIFTPAHPTLTAALGDFFGMRPRAEQPFPFPHNTHVANKVGCTEYCHESVVAGPVAGLPSVKTCMICHSQIATDRPLIKQLAAFEQRGLDIQWQRVYGYTRSAHVRFNHAPHIRAKVDCSTCHGNVAAQTVAERVVDLDMGFCVNCHEEKKASTDCLTCHY